MGPNSAAMSTRSMCTTMSLTFLLLVITCGFTTGYTPVVIIHGLLDSSAQMQDLANLITQAHPGTNVTIPDLFDELLSLDALPKQLPKFREAVENVMADSKGGIHLLCYSQGGLLCRALLANMTDHNVNTFISLSAPLMGQYGDTSYIPFFPQTRSEVYKFCYSSLGQDISVCNYWKDPHHRKEYLNGSIFLPVLNNETYNSQSKLWKDNFLKIKQMILIGGPDDGVITPWQSSHFGYYNENEDVMEMTKQEVFLKDSFGLQTLYNRGAIKTFNISGVEHTKWHGNQTVFDCCIEPFLT